MNEFATVEVHPTVKVVVEGEGASWSAYVPSVPGCIAAGASRDEVVHLIEEGLTIHLAELHEIEFKEIQAELKATANRT